VAALTPLLKHCQHEREERKGENGRSFLVRKQASCLIAEEDKEITSAKGQGGVSQERETVGGRGDSLFTI